MVDTNLLVLAREYKKLREEVKKVLSMPKGDKGDQGEKGEKGDTGDTGPQGFPGRDGKDGINGYDGKDGRDGIDGKDGKDGLDGVGVQNAYIDFDNSLVIVLTDGREINAGFLSQETKDNVVATFKQGAATINDLLPDQEGNANKVLKTDGENVYWGTAVEVLVETDPVVGAVNGLVKANGSGVISAAVAGTDYLAPSAIGTTVQAYDADLTAWAGISTSSKQDTLVSGTNIKTINGNSVLGAGNLTISGGGASFEVGQVLFASEPPTTGTWLETGKYYSKATYPDLATALGSVADFGAFAAVPQAQLPQPFVANNSGTAPYVVATDGTTTVVGGASGAIRRTTDGVNWQGVPSALSNTIAEVRYLNNVFFATAFSGQMAYSTNGTDWINISVASAITMTCVAYGAGVYVVAGNGSQINYSSNLTSWARVQLSAGTTFQRIIFANGLFVLVGTAGALLTSPDGITWTSRSAGSQTFNDVIYANGLFVAVGANNAVYTSPDGVTWTLRTATGSFNQVVYGNSLYVIVGSSGVIFTSPDGVTWTSRTSGTTQNLNSIVWNGSTFVAVGVNGVYSTSSDGITWTPALDASVSNFRSVAVVSGKTIAFGDTSSVILAGTTRQEVLQSGTWAYTVTNQSATNPRIVAYNGTDLYVAAGSNGAILTSSNGQAWTGRFSGVATNFDKVAYLNGNWIVMGGSGSGTNLLTSPDGITWTARTAGTAIFNYAAFGAGVYVVVGASGAVFSSPDLVTWTSRSAGAQTFNDVIFANGVFVAVGASNAVYSSTDGITWTLRTATGTFNRIIYANSLFVAIGNSGVIFTSPDGTTWTSRTSGISTPFTDIVWTGSLFCAVTGGLSGQAGIVTSPDGITWTNVNIGDSTGALWSIAWTGSRFVALGGTNLSSPSPCFIWTSETGAANTWVRQGFSSVFTPRYGAYLGGRVISVSAAAIQTSVDGINWDNADQVQYVPTALNRTYKLGNRYYALSSTAGIYQSSDGVSWTAARTTPTRPFVGMAYNGSFWLALTGASTGQPISVYKSTDGTTWTKVADFGTLTSTSTLPTAFIDIEYANGNFIIGCPVTTAQNILHTIYTSTDGVTWTGRLTPLLAAPSAASAIGSDGTVVVFQSASGTFRSTDGGVTWSIIAPSIGSSGVVYVNGLWNFGGAATSIDLSTIYVNGPGIGGFLYAQNGIAITASPTVTSYKNATSFAASSVYQVNTLNQSAFVTTAKPGVLRSTTAIIAQSRFENLSPNLLSEKPLYSYDTSTTFFVPPSSAGGGQVAYIYAGA